jgi:hypothetical protein
VTVRVAVRVAPPNVPLIATDVDAVTDHVATAKVALVAPAGIVTLAGTVATAALLLESVTRRWLGLSGSDNQPDDRPSEPLSLPFATMANRTAACHCGQLRLEVAGDPFSVSICNCLACQRRTGSAFAMQAGFKKDQVQVSGRFNDYARISDGADRKEHVFHFCPDCGSQVFYTEPTEPDLMVVSVGAFADASFPPPTQSGYDSRRHP